MKPWFYIFYNEFLSYTKALKVMKNEEYDQQKKSTPSKLVNILIIFSLCSFNLGLFFDLHNVKTKKPRNLYDSCSTHTHTHTPYPLCLFTAVFHPDGDVIRSDVNQPYVRQQASSNSAGCCCRVTAAVGPQTSRGKRRRPRPDSARVTGGFPLGGTSRSFHKISKEKRRRLGAPRGVSSPG